MLNNQSQKEFHSCNANGKQISHSINNYQHNHKKHELCIDHGITRYIQPQTNSCIYCINLRDKLPPFKRVFYLCNFTVSAISM